MCTTKHGENYCQEESLVSFCNDHLQIFDALKYYPEASLSNDKIRPIRN